MSEVATGGGEFYKKHRPEEFSELVGQAAAVKILTNMVEAKRVPHALLFVGGSGCGKTTCARILRKKIRCGDSDFVEVNAANLRGVDSIRDIANRMHMAPISGRCRVWLLDEVHQLTGDAQNAFLKMLEDTPKHVYFMLCTTDPGKLKTTIKTRCTELKFSEIKQSDLAKLVKETADKEDMKLSAEVVGKVAETASGSARKALVILQSLLGVTDEEEQLDLIQNADYKSQGIQIARALLDTRTGWNDIAGLLKACDEEPESLRWLVLSYASTVLLGGGKQADRAYCMIQCFSKPFYDTKKAGLVASCWEVITSK